MTEVWKDVQGYEGVYQVSNLGNVKRIYKTQPGYVRAQTTDKDGYKKVRLSKNNTVKNYFVHRLVAAAFCDNPQSFTVVNHKDENKANNCAENLEWCTVQYNTVYKDAHNKRVTNLRKPILQMSLAGEVIAEWPCRSAIKKALGYCESHIAACCLGYRSANTAYGYRWKYK